MKVLHVSTATTWRGGEQQVAYLVNELPRLHVEQVVCCPDNSPLHVACIKQRVVTEPFHSRGLLGISLARHIARIAKTGIDVLHIHDSHAHSAAVISATVFGCKAPIVLSRRVDFPVSGHFLSRWKYNHHSVRKILCVSREIEEVMRRHIADKSKLAVVYDGIDLSRYTNADRSFLHKELGLPDGTRLIGNASALADHKDYFTFVDAAALVAKAMPSAHFVIVGDGPERDTISSYINSKNLGHIISMVGFRNDISKILPCFDVFLMTSVTEGLGSVLLDAFAAGVPVVSTKAGGIPEIVKPEETGLLAPVKDASTLATHVLRLLSDHASAERLRNNALKFVEGFSKEKTAKETFRYYEKALTKR